MRVTQAPPPIGCSCGSRHVAQVCPTVEVARCRDLSSSWGACAGPLQFLTCSEAALLADTPAGVAGIWNCGSQIVEQEGVRSLWKGLTPFAVHLTLKYALRMGTNAFYQSLLRDKVRGLRRRPATWLPCRHAVYGSATCCVTRTGRSRRRQECCLAVHACPCALECGEVADCSRFMSWTASDRAPDMRIASCMRTHLSQNNNRCAVSVTPCAWSEAAHRASGQDNKLSDGRRLAAGFAAGITEALIIVTPFEVVKIRLQQQHGGDKALLKYKVRFPQLRAVCGMSAATALGEVEERGMLHAAGSREASSRERSGLHIIRTVNCHQGMAHMVCMPRLSVASGAPACGCRHCGARRCGVEHGMVAHCAAESS